MPLSEANPPFGDLTKPTFVITFQREAKPQHFRKMKTRKCELEP